MLLAFIDKKAGTERFVIFVTEMFSIIRTTSTYDINHACCFLDLERHDTNVAIALLRATGLHEGQYEEWTGLRDRVHAKLTKAGRDADHILRGLY